jgi:CRP/FNR family transcriptional regulator, cyclic AMP receptor protein
MSTPQSPDDQDPFREVHPALARLVEIPLFSGVPRESACRLLESGQPRSYLDGGVIFERKDEARYVYIVLNGRVHISTEAARDKDREPKRMTVEIFKSEDLFGELGVIDNSPRTATATAKGATQVAALNGAVFRELMQNSPIFSVNLVRLIAARLRHTYLLLEDASLLSLEHRLARQVIYLLGFGASGEPQVRLYSRFNQGDLANLLGTTRRSIIDILNKWRAEGLADFDGRTAQLTILNLQRFRALLSD